MSGGPERSGEAPGDETLLRRAFDSGDAWLEGLRGAVRGTSLGDLGPYRVLATRRGGQGLVLKAVQPGTERVVALKRVGAGHFASDADRRRFEREAELLAGLEHPGIVRVYGIDVVDGLPLLVMEWVEGESLSEWARPRGGPPRALAQRLDTFLAVCDAVHFSHQRGVIHRDLKPSNVLVDGAGKPRVLDFGLARRDELAPSETLTAGFFGTPAFSPPERFAPGPSETDVRGDVWSLGVMLYELLTARLPFEGTSLHDVALHIANEEPSPPSHLCSGIDRDLDAIVMQALAKPVDERYRSASHLADDVRRFLSGEPVAARPRRAGYVFAKWVRRRRATAALGAVSLALVVGGVGYGALQARRIAAERDRVTIEQARTAQALARSEELRREAEEARKAADQAKEESDRNAREARRLQEFYLDHLFAPLIEFGDEDRELAMRFVTRVTDDAPEFFADTPLLGPEILSKVAGALARLGRLDEAASVVERATALLEEQGILYSGVNADLHSLAARVHIAHGERPEAEEELRAALECFAAFGRPTPRPGGYADTACTLADLLAARGEIEEGLALVQLAEELLGEATEDLPFYRELRVRTAATAGRYLVWLGRLGEGEARLRLALERRESEAAPTIGMWVSTEQGLSDLCGARAEWDEAADHVEALFDRCETFAPSSLANTHTLGLGTAVRALRGGRPDVARRLYERMAAEPFPESARTASATALRELDAPEEIAVE